MATDTGVHNIKSQADLDAALKDPSLLVLDCMATWCGPCKVIAPKIVEMAKEYEAARFFKLDVDEVPDVAQKLGVRAMPTFMVFKGGEKIQEIVGANERAVKSAVEAHI